MQYPCGECGAEIETKARGDQQILTVHWRPDTRPGSTEAVFCGGSGDSVPYAEIA